jgi:hypothetical protein
MMVGLRSVVMDYYGDVVLLLMLWLLRLFLVVVSV